MDTPRIRASKPGLYVICKPDGATLEKLRRRRPGSAPFKSGNPLLFPFSIERREETTAAKHAQIAITIKLQVVVEFSDPEAGPAWEYLIDLLHYNVNLLGVLGIVLLDGAQELLHQDFIDLFCFHAFKGQMQMPDGRSHGRAVKGRAARKKELNERLHIGIDTPAALPRAPHRNMPPANHNQVFPQIGMKLPAQL